MNGVFISYINTYIWFIATCAAIIIIIAAVFLHYYYRSRLAAAIKDHANCAQLAAEKVQLEADVSELRNWQEKNRDEIIKLTAERQEQEKLRAENSTLDQEISDKRSSLDAYNIDLSEKIPKIKAIERDLLDLASQINIKNENKNKLIDEINNLITQISDLEKVKSGEEKLLLDIKIKNNELSKLNQDLDTLNKKINEVSNYKDNLLRSIDEENIKLNQLKEQNTKLLNEIDYKINSVKEEQTKFNNLQYQINVANKDISERELKIKTIEQNL
ncbi:MAG: hypothetical protein LBE31_10565, partial [Deltaproteobacteria bacterium]|nr:hypothetical protein [Deltaproteobacteria bacterium]